MIKLNQKVVIVGAGPGGLAAAILLARSGVPLAFEYTFWDERLPEVLISCGEAIKIADGQLHSAVEWSEQLATALAFAQDELAALSKLRDPALFTTVLAGRVGIGGVYDAWKEAPCLTEWARVSREPREHPPPMSNIWLIGLALCCATVPALLWVWNMLVYREPEAGSCAEMGQCVLPDAVSVLIPARNEERVIAASLTSLLASRGVQIEIIVLDDASTDRTAEIVLGFAARDPRVRLESSPPLPGGWNGKQHACHALAAMAHSNILCFLDADVRLAPEALARMSAFLMRSGSDLVSGFPRQETETFLEWLLLPLIHFVLLSYLPLAGMRALSAPGFAVGCGQFLMVRRNAYRKSGGHAQIRTTMHDGLLLPQLFRRHGLRTDIADLTHLATCRMYHNASEVWRGLAKNATEGMASPARILPFTFLLFCGQILPLLLALSLLFHGTLHGTPGQAGQVAPGWYSGLGQSLILAALAASFVPRLLSVWKYRQPLLSACLHPLGVAVLLTIQWYALLRKIAGQQVTWKERAYRVG